MIHHHERCRGFVGPQQAWGRVIHTHTKRRVFPGYAEAQVGVGPVHCIVFPPFKCHNANVSL
jgi:hypothetical protein